MMKYTGIILALCLSSCMTISQSSTTADGTTVRQSVFALGKTKIEAGLLDYEGIFPTESINDPVRITSGTGVKNVETDMDIIEAITILAPLLKGISTLAP